MAPKVCVCLPYAGFHPLSTFYVNGVSIPSIRLTFMDFLRDSGFRPVVRTIV